MTRRFHFVLFGCWQKPKEGVDPLELEVVLSTHIECRADSCPQKEQVFLAIYPLPVLVHLFTI